MDLKELKAQGAVIRNHPWEAARAEFFNDLIAAASPAREEVTIYDVGCGDGYFAAQLAGAFPGSRVLGVDTSFEPELLAQLDKRWQGRAVAFYPTVEAAYRDGGKASWILLLDVIEHIEDDEGFLKWLGNQPLIAPETLLLVSVPCNPWLFCEHDRWLGHFRRYSQTSLREVLGRAGFRVQNQACLWSSLVFPRTLQMLGERLRPGPPGRPSGVVTWEGSAWSYDLVRRILRWEAALDWKLARAGIHLPGLSVFAVASKS